MSDSIFEKGKQVEIIGCNYPHARGSERTNCWCAHVGKKVQLEERIVPPIVGMEPRWTVKGLALLLYEDCLVKAVPVSSLAPRKAESRKVTPRKSAPRRNRRVAAPS